MYRTPCRSTWRFKGRHKGKNPKEKEKKEKGSSAHLPESVAMAAIAANDGDRDPEDIGEIP